MRAWSRSPCVRTRRMYSGGKMWQWRSTPLNGPSRPAPSPAAARDPRGSPTRHWMRRPVHLLSEGGADALERNPAVADFVPRLRVPVGLERQWAVVAVPAQQLELALPADFTSPDGVPGGQAGRGVDDVRVLHVDEADLAADGLVALLVRVAAGDEAVPRVPHRLERRVVDGAEDAAGVVARVRPARAHVLETEDQPGVGGDLGGAAHLRRDLLEPPIGDVAALRQSRAGIAETDHAVAPERVAAHDRRAQPRGDADLGAQ